MKNTPFTTAVDEVVALKMRAVDEYIKEIIEPLGQVGSPETLIGKKYEEWTPVDLQLLSQVYGQGDDTPVAKLIAKKNIERVENLEKQVKDFEQGV